MILCQSPIPVAESPVTVDIMRQLFREFEERQQTETNKIITGVIEQHIKPLSAAIVKEREDRMQYISKIQ